jgi:AcrR family transcriptional regulator
VVTRTRILDASERLFAQEGYGASLREITTAAGVNLAAVNYHFGSKEELLVAVVLRRIDEANAMRLAALDELEAKGESSVEELVEVFLRPALAYAADKQGAGGHFMRLLARVHGDPDGPWRRVLASGAFDEVQTRFLAAFRAACPNLSERDLLWRLHLVVGAMVQTLLHPEVLLEISQGTCDPRDSEAALAQLVPFLSAGLKAHPSQA